MDVHRLQLFIAAVIAMRTAQRPCRHCSMGQGCVYVTLQHLLYLWPPCCSLQHNSCAQLSSYTRCVHNNILYHQPVCCLATKITQWDLLILNCKYLRSNRQQNQFTFYHAIYVCLSHISAWPMLSSIRICRLKLKIIGLYWNWSKTLYCKTKLDLCPNSCPSVPSLALCWDKRVENVAVFTTLPLFTSFTVITFYRSLILLQTAVLLNTRLTQCKFNNSSNSSFQIIKKTCSPVFTELF